MLIVAKNSFKTQNGYLFHQLYPFYLYMTADWNFSYERSSLVMIGGIQQNIRLCMLGLF